MTPQGELTRGKLPHLLLSVASLAPTSLRELMARVEARHGFQDRAMTSYRSAAGLLLKKKMLARLGGHPGPSGAALYTLTATGEAELDRLWDLEHGRSAA